MVGKMLSHYRLVERIGEGGMGEVYRAHDTRLGRDVAIKVLSPRLAVTPDVRARFEREARTISRLGHSHICTLYDIGQQEGTDYLVMELLEGETLAHRLEKGPLPVAEVLALGAQIAEALDRAHRAGVVHRDLKPGNVMLTKGGAKLMDFGLARAAGLAGAVPGALTDSPTVSRPLTREGTIVGTIEYMAPEQLEGREADARSDLWALGCVLYEMATGKRAFEGESQASLIAAILKDEPRPMMELRPVTPPGLERVARRCLQKDPDARFQSASDLAFGLETLRLQEPEATAHAATRGASPRIRSRPRYAAAFVAGVPLVAAIAFLIIRQPSHPQPTFKKLSFGKGLAGAARFTPDGNSVLYSARWENRANEVFITRVEAPGATPLGIGEVAAVVGVSGGEAAVLLGAAGAFAPFWARTLATIPIGGGGPRPVLDGVMAADWSRDGKRFAVVRSVPGGQRLEYPPGEVLFETAGSIGSPRISPRGDRVAFAHYLAPRDLFGSVLVVDSKRRVSALSEGWSLVSLAWSRDGSEVWFSAGEVWGWFSIYGVRLDGKLRTVLEAPTSLIVDEVFRDGRVLMRSGTIRQELWGQGPGESTEHSFSWLDGTWAAGVSADGKSLLFGEAGAGGGRTRSVYLRRLDGSAPVRLGEGSAQGLSPDGAWALSALKVPKPALRLIPTGAGETRTLPPGSIARYHAAFFFPDGKRALIVGSEAGRRQRLFVQDVGGGLPRAISDEGVTAWASFCISPDGTQVAAMAGDRPVFVSANGGEPRSIEGLLPGETPIAWTRDGRALFVAESAAGPLFVRIVRFDLASRKRTLWRELRPADPSGAIVYAMPIIAQDGDVYFYWVNRFDTNVYLVEGLK